jgi:hypothetical protein
MVEKSPGPDDSFIFGNIEDALFVGAELVPKILGVLGWPNIELFLLLSGGLFDILLFNSQIIN